ncbi:RNA polymerase sigma factor [Anaerobacillus sp. CMMVII]|uniref:RNA polymerase sigma factor n=1 Tax=Anaerobacillus sp. CMMVII TaxID=2755588 RepID=UPI0021B769DE|nr:RNA polymerase sigma factor [Anaerobacillus sp. CMMVII]
MEEELAKEKIQQWYGLYSDEIYRFILMMIGDHAEAKDLMHDTFLRAYNGLASFEGKASEKNWLYKIARNTTIDFQRKRRPIQYVVESFTTYPSAERCPEQLATLGEAEEILYRSLKKLKRPYQEVIILRKIKGLTIEETAEILNWNESKVKNTLFRGLAALKQQMEKEGYNHETA